MKPKSRLYALVKNWTQKPSLSVKEVAQAPLYEVLSHPEPEQLKAWKTNQSLHYQLVLRAKDQMTEFVFCKSTEDQTTEEASKLLKEGIQAATYWHYLAKPHSILLSFSNQGLTQGSLMKELEELLLACHLPIGFIYIGIEDRPPLTDMAGFDQALKQLKRMGILLHLLNFEGNEIDCEVLARHQFTHIHLKPDLIRQAIPGSPCEKKLIALKTLINHHEAICVAGPIRLMHDKQVAERHLIECYFGPHIMPAMTFNQIMKVGKSKHQQSAIKQLIKQEVKQR
jgi:EAL domain-containing protein (putative c-di-GMP-specific phosphodiesterase class I)